MVSPRFDVSPRRRRNRPKWSLERQQQEKDDSDRGVSVSPPLFSPSPSCSLRQQHQQQHPQQSSSPPPLPSPSNRTAEVASAVPFSSSQPLHSSSKTRKLLATVLVSACLFLVVLLSANADTHTNDGMRSLESSREGEATPIIALRRRLVPWTDMATEGSHHPQDVVPRYLSFGGPATYGRGLEPAKRTVEAYPYLLSSMTSKKSFANKKSVFVHNVAHPTFEATGPTLASLCTQSIVEGTGTSANDLESASTDYSVITLEYSLDTTTTNAGISSIQLLVKRLRQRYPHATMVLVRLWTPAELVYYDAASNTTVSYEEWRRDPLQEKQAKVEPHSWTFRELSQMEQQMENDLESTMDLNGGIVYRMHRPQNSEELLAAMEDWFLEEESCDDHNSEDTHPGAAALSFRYTLSREGHATVAKGIQSALKQQQQQQQQQHRLLPVAHRLSSSPPLLSSSAPLPPGVDGGVSSERLHTWGSGDSCWFWYETAPENIDPSHYEYSRGLQPREIAHGLHALEVVPTSRGGGGATLRVHNPFETDRLVYLTYLTAAEGSASNKVYPKTKVKMVTEAKEEERNGNFGTISVGQQKLQLSQTSSTSVLLDPSHSSATGLDQKHHFTRTSAVGVLPPQQTGTLEFLPLEEYTIHPFRIVGVSVLYQDDDDDHEGSSGSNDATGQRVPMEFGMFSPRRLSVDQEGLGDEFNDDDESGEDEVTKKTTQ